MTEAEIEFVGYVQIEMSKQNAHTGEYKMEYKNECMTLRTHTHIHTATHTYTHLHTPTRNLHNALDKVLGYNTKLYKMRILNRQKL